MTNIDQALVDQMAQTITDALVGCDLRTTRAAVYGGNVAAGAVTPLIARALEQAYDDGYNDAVTMARCYGHTDHWPEDEEPSNPYRAKATP